MNLDKAGSCYECPFFYLPIVLSFGLFYRQHNHKFTSFSNLAFDFNAAAVLFDYAVTDRKSQAGSLANLFGSEEGFEYP